MNSQIIPGYAGCWLAASAVKPDTGTPRWLLLHGFTGLSLDWTEVWPGDHPALAIDLPGHGQSQNPIGDVHQEIERLLDALPIEIDSLAGYSLGGRIALSLLAQAPRRFHRLVILSAHPGLVDPNERQIRRQHDQHWISRLQHGDIKRFAAAWQRQPLFRTQHLSNPAAVRRQHQRRLAQNPAGLASNLACFGLGQMPPTWSAIRDYRGDLLWISGDEDTKFRAIAEQVRQMRPGARHGVIPNCGHNPLIETPAALAALLREAM